MFLEELCQKTSDIKNEKILIFGGSGSLGLATINRWIKDNDIVMFQGMKRNNGIFLII
jgi:hypothetical protein